MQQRPTCEQSAYHDTTNRKGAGVLIVDSDTGSVLLGLRGNICSNPATWAPFGGMVEQGEEPEAGALRELEEEASVSVMFTEKPILLYVNQGRDGFQFYTYLVIQSGRCAVEINEESSGFGWFRFDRLPKDLHPGFQELVEHGNWHMLCAQFGSEVQKGDAEYLATYLPGSSQPKI